MLTIDLPPEAENQLGAIAAAAGQTREDFIREMVLDRLEDIEDVRVAEERLAEIRAGRSGTVSLEEVMARYGLEY